MPRTSVGDAAAVRKALYKKFDGQLLSLQPGFFKPVEAISTGAILLDYSLGVGGFPRGRLIELFGKQSSGKSTLSLQAAANCQALGEAVLWLDHEHAFDPLYAHAVGVDLSEDKFMFGQPDTLERSLEIIETVLKYKAAGMIIVDSLAAMVPQKELEDGIADPHVALQARALSQGLRRINAVLDEANAVLIFLNHLRELIGTMSWGKQESTPGGTALKFYASVRVKLVAVESVKGKKYDPVTGGLIDGPVASKVRAEIVKNKVAPPFNKAEFYLAPGRGIDDARTVVDIAVARHVIKQAGARYNLPEINPNTGQPYNLNGIASVYRHYNDHPESYTALRKQIVSLVNAGPVGKGAPGPKDISDVGLEEDDEFVLDDGSPSGDEAPELDAAAALEE